MAELKIYISDVLDKRFRMTAMSVLGYGRGSLSKAAEDALARWCDQHAVQNAGQEPKTEPAGSNSDPAARAEERPTNTSAGEENNSPSAPQAG